jgi:nitrate reductase (cytochrome), electron transfer subunit
MSNENTGNTDKPAGGLRRLLNVWLAVALGVSALGFAVGLRTVQAPVQELTPERSSFDTSTARPPTAYPALRDQTARAQAATGDLATLEAGVPARGAEAARVDPQDEARLRPDARRRRAERRAYDGAPPTIPHPIAERNAVACLSCHVDGLKLADKVAPPMPHQAYASCVQCHVAASDSPLPAAVEAANEFRGLSSDLEAARAWPGAPPVIPHTTWQRERCDSCHGPAGKPGLRTSHPERQSCVQCHAASTWPNSSPVDWPVAAAF